MARKKKNNNPFAGLILGPALIVFSVTGLWKNEHRFDYHKAAQKTVAADQVAALQSGQIFSYTGGMDQSLTMNGHYVESFTGYLTVRRSAEIYAWDEDRDDDETTWTKEWMSRLESNSRNSKLSQRLSSERYMPDTFQTGELEIGTGKIEFVDPFSDILPSSLVLSANGRSQNFEIQDSYFYLSKGASDQLGDERLSYEGIPVPRTATYFGKYGGERAVAHQAVQREGIISDIIQDTGVLHHLVKGEREAALATMKAHIARLKMIVRGFGTLVNVIGWAVLFGVLTRFLVHIPLIGLHIRSGTAMLGVGIGLAASVITIGVAYITSHPLILGVILLAAIGVVFLIVKAARSSQKTVRAGLEREVGASLSSGQIKEMEFAELVRLCSLDGKVDISEFRYLQDWGKNHGWDDAKIRNLIQEAHTNSGDARDHLIQLIRLALADGSLDEREMKTIHKAAKDSGFRGELGGLIREARQMGMAAAV